MTHQVVTYSVGATPDQRERMGFVVPDGVTRAHFHMIGPRSWWCMQIFPPDQPCAVVRLKRDKWVVVNPDHYTYSTFHDYVLSQPCYTTCKIALAVWKLGGAA